MILDQFQIKNIIVNKPNQKLINKGVEYNRLLRFHMYGEGMKDKVMKIEDYETQSLHTLRGKYARSNKDLFARLSRPIDKVFSARGGSIYYQLSDAQDKAARNLSQNVRNGFSIRKWIEAFWKPHMLDDPFGVVFLEILPTTEAIAAKQQGRSFVYPTYKSIGSVYDYLPKGSALEYIVFTVSANEKKQAGLRDEDQVYRVVDDAYDYWVRRDGDTVTVIAEHTFPNFFGQVPGQINSDIISPENDDCFLSLYDEVIELADNFFLDGSIRITHKIQHGYPKYWELADSCNACNGTTFLNGESCTFCKGTGKRIMLKVSDAKLLPYPDKDNPSPAPNVAGYVSPDKVYFEISTADLQMLEELMNVTLWGAQSKVKTQGMSTDKNQDTKTATEVMDDIKPQADRLNIISKMAEKRHKFILDAVIRLQLSPTYAGASVNYGRRYMIEGPDEVWKKYSDARLSGAAMSVLDDLLIEYYETKYSSDPVKLAIQTKLMKVEPFVHLTADKVDLSMSITHEDKTAKAYFGEWLSTLNEAMLLSFSPELLREQLTTYATEKATAIQKANDDKMKKEADLKQTKPVV
jgi:hypothetical protein